MTRDTEILGEERILSQEKLWYGETPQDVGAYWAALKQALLQQEPHWQTLIEWYEDRLAGDAAAARAGRPPIQDMALEIANLPDDVWQNAKSANEAIADIQARYWRPNGTDAGPDSNLVIPPQRPAVLETIWVDGILRLPHGPAAANLNQQARASGAGCAKTADRSTGG